MNNDVRRLLRTEPTPLEINCKRKIAYPTAVMADKACQAMQEKEGAEYYYYQCELCNKFHIAHKESENLRREKELEETSLNYKFFHRHEGIYYAKIRDAFYNQYVFIVPDGIQEWENEILEHGILVAYKKGHDLMREKGGIKSDNFRLFAPILPVIVKDQIEFSKKIEDHMENMCSLNEAINLLLNNSETTSMTLADRIGKKIIVRNPPVDDKDLVEEHVKSHEMYKGREVFRDERNRPYWRTYEPCSATGCTNKVELRAYICQDRQGKFTWTRVRNAVEPALMTADKKWLCGKCDGKIGVSSMTETERRQPMEETGNQVLNDLQKIASDPSVESDFVRGAALMACLILKEHN